MVREIVQGSTGERAGAPAGPRVIGGSPGRRGAHRGAGNWKNARCHPICSEAAINPRGVAGEGTRFRVKHDGLTIPWDGILYLVAD